MLHWGAMSRLLRSLQLLSLAVCGACAAAAEEAEPLPLTAAAPQRPGLCSRPGADAVRDLFCAPEPAAISSLRELEDRLAFELSVAPTAYPDSIDPRYVTQSPNAAQVVLLGHSTALSGELVSEINPRAILLRDNLALAFTRGIQQVELAARDRDRGRLNFYLLGFEQACAAVGCSPAQRYGPRIESDWTRVSLQDDEDLKNTPSDCRQCHQRGRDEPQLLMRELNGPWQHFFGHVEDASNPFPEASGGDLMRDFLAAKGNEAYAGVPSEVLRGTQSFILRNFVEIDQPLVFEGLQIQRERWQLAPGAYATEPRRSATWDAAFQAFTRGEQLALPYFAARASDPEKLSQLTTAYREGDPEALPELADVFPDDPQTRAEIGLITSPDATPAQTLIEACGSCHNDVLDQSLTRARFNIALGRLDAAERAAAVQRLRLPRNSAGAMPPPGARQLADGALERLIECLEQDSWPQADEALLERAAELGMAGKR